MIKYNHKQTRGNKMKAKITKIITSTILTIILALLIILAYFLIIDIESKVPKEVEQECIVETKQFMNRNIFIITPKNEPKSNKKILYFHGGSYMAEASKAHWNFIEKLIKDLGVTVILPDYPLSPKYTYKDVFSMVIPLYKEIIEKVDANDLIVMGDSAGGGLSLAMEEKLNEEGNIKMPSKTILISPWLDVRLENPKIEEYQKNDTELNKETLKLAGLAYATPEGINNYLVNPIDGNLSKLQNVTIFIGTYDILNPDVHLLQEKAKEQGVEIEVKEYQQAKHIWLIENNSSEEITKKAYNDLINTIKQ